MPTHKRPNKCRRFERFHANRTQAQAEGFRSVFRYAIDEMGARHEYLASKTGPDPVANWTELAIEVEKLLLDCNLPLGRVKKDLVPSPKQWQEFAYEKDRELEEPERLVAADSTAQSAPTTPGSPPA